MKSSVCIIAIAALLGAASVGVCAQGSGRGPSFATEHLIKLQPSEEARLLSVLQAFNQLFTELGYPDVRYRLWKLAEDSTMQWSHRWDSVWPDRDTYDKVHQDDAFRKLLGKHRSYLEEILKGGVYCRFNEVTPAVKSK